MSQETADQRVEAAVKAPIKRLCVACGRYKRRLHSDRCGNCERKPVREPRQVSFDTLAYIDALMLQARENDKMRGVRT